MSIVGNTSTGCNILNNNGNCVKFGSVFRKLSKLSVFRKLSNYDEMKFLGCLIKNIQLHLICSYVLKSQVFIKVMWVSASQQDKGR